MTGLQNFLRSLGHDLGVFGDWVLEGLPIAGSVLEAIDPPLTPIVNMVEGIVKDLANIHKVPSSEDLKSITKAVTLLQTVQTTIAQGQLKQLDKVLEKAASADQKV